MRHSIIRLQDELGEFATVDDVEWLLARCVAVAWRLPQRAANTAVRTMRGGSGCLPLGSLGVLDAPERGEAGSSGKGKGKSTASLRVAASAEAEADDGVTSTS